MMKRSLALAVVSVVSGSAFAQVTLSPLSSFGTNGYLAPGSASYLTSSGDTQRGLAYNAATGNLVLVNRAGGLSVNLLNGLTGASAGALDVTGISGGIFAGNNVGVTSDGQIYVTNLTTNASTSSFKVYKYSSEAAGLSAGPSVLYSGAPAAARFGDSFDVIGSGNDVTLVAGAGSNPAGFNGYAILKDDGTSGTASYVSFAGSPPAAGDFRLGVTFAGNATTVYGKQGGVATGRYTTYSGTTGTLVGSNSLTVAQETILDIAKVKGRTMLATLDYVTSNVRIYDLTDPSAPSLLAMAKTESGTHNTNANGVGSIRFGSIVGGKATLYALNPNNGIQAFQLDVVPEPGTFAALGIGAVALLRRRKSADRG